MRASVQGRPGPSGGTRDEREAKAAFTAELQAQGLAIYSEQPYVPWQKALENLRDGDGNEITPEAHATCPGRAVTITYDWDWAPEAEDAYRAAHGLAADDDLAAVEFESDEEARAAAAEPHQAAGMTPDLVPAAASASPGQPTTHLPFDTGCS